jgi:hypothetical protein
MAAVPKEPTTPSQPSPPPATALTSGAGGSPGPEAPSQAPGDRIALAVWVLGALTMASLLLYDLAVSLLRAVRG